MHTEGSKRPWQIPVSSTASLGATTSSWKHPAAKRSAVGICSDRGKCGGGFVASTLSPPRLLVAAAFESLWLAVWASAAGCREATATGHKGTRDAAITRPPLPPPPIPPPPSPGADDQDRVNDEAANVPLEGMRLVARTAARGGTSPRRRASGQELISSQPSAGPLAPKRAKCIRAVTAAAATAA